MRKPKHWGESWTTIAPHGRSEALRRFISEELEETRAFVRRLLASHHRRLPMPPQEQLPVKSRNDRAG